MRGLESLGASFPFMVGPMVGLSHVAFRELIRSFTPANLDIKLFSEMLSTLRLPSERLDLSEELQITKRDRGSMIPQILGNEEWYIERSLRKLDHLEPWGIDINMGCPVKRTLRHNWGVRLMGDEDYAARVVETTRRHYQGPLSVKMRCGLKKEDPAYIDSFTAKLEAAGADWITIHARLQAEKHRGDANWSALTSVKKARKIPVVGNGDIQTSSDAIDMIEKYGLDGAMIGRAATARPWILWQIAHDLGLELEAPEGFSSPVPPRSREDEGMAYLMAVERFIALVDKHFENETKKVRKIRFFVTHSHRWLTFGHSFYSRCMKAKSIEALADTVRRYRETVSSFPMSERINLL
ncbi:tRNA dihydrouridine synthase [Pseudobacteriovorax antillogorgiicola]|uniref:tRNA-dihydrouridine synthase n=2 Tax=Pseudobacteriovorax antillogorgiicola TaxID=1513793 RepID=A0A1Y6BGU4_9BACT|nr:tRNA-dihydrouridine synthase family protein [Pseudobacteriovorax antillogorgiicola]TCS56327.1 tRNA-dihydrouridine synthase [Pseudobacteriovorax antillogorgiicola]SMF07010.1 tRNA-dihydrouridine synthase [Pseudobacteriovorax antillogorgiicola]